VLLLPVQLAAPEKSRFPRLPAGSVCVTVLRSLSCRRPRGRIGSGHRTESASGFRHSASGSIIFIRLWAPGFRIQRPGRPIELCLRPELSHLWLGPDRGSIDALFSSLL
jgi:hypothetical protein